MNTTESNKLIAEFIGAIRTYVSREDYEYDMYGIIDCIEDGENEQHYFTSQSMKFNTSWDWIMTVVEKIESVGYDIFINGLYCRITDSGVTDFEIESGEVKTKIEAVYNAVHEFILWYNKQKSRKRKTVEQNNVYIKRHKRK